MVSILLEEMGNIISIDAFYKEFMDVFTETDFVNIHELYSISVKIKPMNVYK